MIIRILVATTIYITNFRTYRSTRDIISSLASRS